MAEVLSGYLHTDDRDDVIDSLRQLLACLGELPGEPRYWKWAVLAAHSAAQGSLVCFLTDMAGIDCLTDKSRRDFLAWFEESRTNPHIERPREWLADFKVLLKRAGSAKSTRLWDDQPIELDEKTKADLTKLHDGLRKQFVHFSPKSWVIDLADLPRILHAAVRLSCELMMERMTNVSRLDDRQIAALAELLPRIEEELCRLDENNAISDGTNIQRRIDALRARAFRVG